MIKSIQIENFRSIIHTKLTLNKLNVIVGANATGKSNLIKAIEFFSDLASLGLNEAIYRRGGYTEIIPKQYRKKYHVSSK